MGEKMPYTATPLLTWEFVVDLEFLIGFMLGAFTIGGLTWPRRRQLSRRVGAAIHLERQRIARELHDTVGHGMLLVSMCARRLPLVAPRAKPVAEAIDDAVHATLNDVRRLVGELRAHPPTGSDDPARGALGARLARTRTRERVSSTVAESFSEHTLAGGITELGVRTPGAGFTVMLENAGVQDRLQAELRHTAYRIVQEGLTNAVKHGGGPVRASLRFGDELELCVASGAASTAGDDIHTLPIVPFIERGQNVCHGLAGLRERVQEVNGSFECGTLPSGGFLVRARIPTNESTARWYDRGSRCMKSAS
ncbi:sensor histidine kinase [Actinomadura litoris]|uniref:histidine kinase n=1 Tax=Actinomadura litoris TaxID=2678616 RepID=A0A7K1L225_9ACTN|nr:histidine kinase [Actinomadura litoris]MUN38437.1 hypothetical protein [Actinomadura litoris]